jgi:O-acetyl-ADP-ribose deacetylase (regulator of RNase III)
MRRPIYQRIETLGFGGGIALAIDEVERRLDGERREEALLQIAPEAGRMALGQADIFVEMERRDPGPVDALGCNEILQHLELARACGDDDRRLAMAGNRRADRLGAERRCLLAELVLVWGDADIDHAAPARHGCGDF